jgi:hypothetical protein
MGLEEVKRMILPLIGLAVLMTLLVTFNKPLLDKMAETVQNLLGDFGTQSQFKITKRDPALDSINALLYGINVVSWRDTPESASKVTDINKKLDKQFGNVKTREIIDDSEKIPLEETTYRQAIAKSMIDCYKIYFDKGEKNSRCFLYEIKKQGLILTEDEVAKILNEYLQNVKCNAECKRIISDLNSGIPGIKPNDFSIESGIKLDEGQFIYICAQNKLLLGYDIVFSSSSNYCNAEVTKSKYSMRIENFNLPQKITNNANIPDAIEKWITRNGDPQYIMYYEVFPEGEDAYWQKSAYETDFLTTLTVEGAFFLFDVIPIAGKASKFFIMKIPGLKGLSEKMAKNTVMFLRKNAKISLTLDIIKKLKEDILPFFDELFKLSKEAIENGFQSLTKSAKTGRERIFRAIFSNHIFRIPSEGIESIVKSFSHIYTGDLEQNELKRIIKESAEKIEKLSTDDKIFAQMFDEEGKLTAGYRNQIKDDILKYVQKMQQAAGNNIDKDKLATEISSKIVNEMESKADRFIAGSGLEASVLWTYKKTVGVTRRISEMFGLPAEERKTAVHALILHADEYLYAMDPKDLAKFGSTMDSNVEITLDLLKKDDSAIRELFGTADNKFLSDFKKLADTEKEAAIFARMDTLFTDIDFAKEDYLKAKAWGYISTTGKRYSKKVMYSFATLWAVSSLEESINEKFTPVGTNAIGVRTPYFATVVYNDEKNSINKESKTMKDYNEFFNHFGGYEEKVIDKETKAETNGVYNPKYNQYSGLLPEVSKYYLTLLQDQGWFAQKNQRFHLESPCSADIYVKVTSCECHGRPLSETRDPKENIISQMLFQSQGVYETGSYNPELQKYVNHFDQKNPMLYTIEEGNIIKQCWPSGTWQDIVTFKDKVYTPICIEINPVLKATSSPNYCYKGNLPPEVTAANIAVNYVIPISSSLACGAAGEAICGPIAGAAGAATTGPGGLITAIGGAQACGILGSASCGFAAGVVGGISYAYCFNSRTAWPAHGYDKGSADTTKLAICQAFYKGI